MCHRHHSSLHWGKAAARRLVADPRGTHRSPDAEPAIEAISAAAGPCRATPGAGQDSWDAAVRGVRAGYGADEIGARGLFGYGKPEEG